MNIFRICGDVIHLVSFFVILRKIYGSKADSCRGASTAVAGSILPAARGRNDTRYNLMYNNTHLQSYIPGVSLKTQELYAVVFVCRYLDLFYNFISL